jgi:site-specific DNA-methyltransferase (adenine-specific)
MMSKLAPTPPLASSDVLETLAQLPNDEVFTAPSIAREMLNLLPEEVWSNPDLRWLDPGTKSGVFLREVCNRLMVGLRTWEPDNLKRREYILRNMLFGAAITSLTGELARRTVYQSADATGQKLRDNSVSPVFVRMSSPEGNIRFIETTHRIKNGKCDLCRAPANLVRDSRENFAYSFIHNTYPTIEMTKMKFDVIIGNPPYQIGMEDSEGNRTKNITPLYNLFVDKAIELNPKYVLMITPSRWFSGGKGLNEYRDRMLNDRRIRSIHDYSNAKEVFPGVEIKGGVSFFLWDRDYDGDCSFVQMSEGAAISETTRDLRTGNGVVIRDNFAAEIVDKILTTTPADKTLADIVSPRDPFGASIRTNFKGAEPEPFKGSIPLVFVSQIGYINPSILERNHHWVEQYKVLIPKASDGRGGNENLSILGEPIALAPGSACTQSYLVAGTFEKASETVNYAKYLTTKFVRFLVLQRKVSQDLTQSRFAFVPLLGMHKEWTDTELYKLHNLNDEEIAYIDKVISDRDWIDSIRSSIPDTHLPGGRKYRPGDTSVEEEDDEEMDE